eukprot:453484_1
MDINYANIDETDIDSILDEIEKRENTLETSKSHTSIDLENTLDLVEIEEKKHVVTTLKRQKSNVEQQTFVQSKLFSDLKTKLTHSACTIIVFGASGHLAKTKTYPALYDLFCENVFPDNVNIIGFARSKLSKKEFHNKISMKLKG